MRRGPGEIPAEAIYPRAYSARTSAPIPPRPGLALPPGPEAQPSVSAAGSLIQSVRRGWTPPEEFYPPFQERRFGGFGDVQEDAGIEQDIANRVQSEGQRISADESRRAWAVILPPLPKVFSLSSTVHALC